MKVTQAMIDAFKTAELCRCHPEDEVGTRIQAVLDLIGRNQAEELRAFSAAKAYYRTDGSADAHNELMAAMADLWAAESGMKP